jgi:hypothetical protein
MIGHSLLTLVPGASGAGSEWYARDLVVVSRGTSRPEVCGDAARYVDPLSSGDIAEGIEDVLRNSAGLVEAGRRRAAHLTLEACVRAHDAVYGELAA